MGAKVVNVNIGTDWARPDQQRQVELHMSLPISAETAVIMNDLLASGQWAKAKNLLTAIYPQHQDIIQKWFAASEHRASGAMEKELENT